MRTILNWLIFSFLIILTAHFIPGIHIENFFPSAVILALIMSLINVLIKPVLKLITLPVNFFTLGIFGIILNALLFMLAGYFAPGVSIEGFWPALFGSLVLGFLEGIVFHTKER